MRETAAGAGHSHIVGGNGRLWVGVDREASRGVLNRDQSDDRRAYRVLRAAKRQARYWRVESHISLKTVNARQEDYGLPG